jgi:ADP-ribose pyrophosphatase YjhB (NUDIX family)
VSPSGRTANVPAIRPRGYTPGMAPSPAGRAPVPRWLARARRAGRRLLRPRFPVGAAALIRDPAGRVLLVRQPYHRPPSWWPPGGWVGRGETPRQAAAREAYEEVGVRVAVGRPLAVGVGPYGQLNIVFECRAIDDRAARPGSEVDRAAFFAPSRLPLRGEGRRLIEEALAAQGPADPPARPLPRSRHP